MGKRSIVLLVALVLAAVSAFAVWQYLASVEQDVRADIVEVKVFRAARAIETGTTGDDARLFIQESTALVESIVFDGSQILCTGPKVRDASADANICEGLPGDLNVVLDSKVAAGPISHGQLITTAMFVAPAELNTAGLANEIPINRVAISIRPEDDAASGGYIRPGDRINILATASVELDGSVEVFLDPDLRRRVFGEEETPVPAASEGPDGEASQESGARSSEDFPTSFQYTQTILQDIEVLAVGADSALRPAAESDELPFGQAVVLSVTPEQAEVIELARNYATLALSLLPSEQVYTPIDTVGVILDDLFGVVQRIQEKLANAEGTLGG